MREIKFRAWNGKRMLFCGKDGYCDFIIEQGEIATFGEFDLRERGTPDWPLMQFTGLTDKNGVDIYEGDILEINEPYRDQQTHTGDNIPMGSYTEPLEPYIKTTTAKVIFNDGCFCIDEPTHMMDFLPLAFMNITFSIDDAKDGFCGGWAQYSDTNSPFKWNDEEEGDLQCLLDTYDLAEEDMLLKMLGIKVIGNIHESPELLTQSPVSAV